MHINIFFILFTFVIIVAIVLISDDLTSAMLTISVLANFLVITAQFNSQASKRIGGSVKPTTSETASQQETLPQTAASSEADEKTRPHDAQNTAIYGKEYEVYHAHQESYSTCYKEPQPLAVLSCSEKNYGIDSANVLLERRRTRDKRAMDGYVSKSADYYKMHYGD